jgi:hypothetical protein
MSDTSSGRVISKYNVFGMSRTNEILITKENISTLHNTIAAMRKEFGCNHLQLALTIHGAKELKQFFHLREHDSDRNHGDQHKDDGGEELDNVVSDTFPDALLGAWGDLLDIRGKSHTATIAGPGSGRVNSVLAGSTEIDRAIV